MSGTTKRIIIFVKSGIKQIKETVAVNRKIIAKALGRFIIFLAKTLIESYFKNLF